ncbi:hypothetical protein FHT44_005139 [Mycolicibacterium sp. BK634]|uniref:hypothetical protein n=1 Tax=Mycolicibacterium sp. BK634 TaxID=2587099 RepID=UPI00161D808E|nr:hypothetical protein [Mycolicibacterium sp. BK634]MBB3752627.1 hypothetical protein [Mycolicibacterium sp. BK634]
MFATGRLVDHDPRSRQFRHTFTATSLKPVDWDDDAPITDQGQIGGCTGWTMLDILNNHLFRGNRVHATKSDALLPNNKGLDLYSRATRLDGIANNTYPPTDEGSSGLGAVKAGKAEKFVLTYTHGFSMNDFLVALQHQPVMVGTVWTQGMFDPDKTGLVRPTGVQQGGHEYGAFGYNPATGLIKFRNHWTDQWGVKGRFYIRATDFEKLLAAQGDVTIPAPIPVTA